MFGPEIIVRSITAQRIGDQHGNEWQYHPQSDRHSKIACWAILFDLLIRCALLRRHVAEDRVGFGINHTMTDFTSGRDKDLDLVLSEPRKEDGAASKQRLNFNELADHYGILLTTDERDVLTSLPVLRNRPVGDVLLALEAKAVMTAHVGAGPRLFDELTSAWQCVNGAAPQAIAVGFAMVNASPDFVSPKQNKFSVHERPPVVNYETQPAAALRAHDRVRMINVRRHTNQGGYDAKAILTVMASNDGKAITLAPVPPGLGNDDPLHYERMVLRVAGLYDGRFAAR